jgi:hypothetical protein
MTRESHTAKPAGNRHHWQTHVKAFRQSGLSRAEYCRRHSLSYHALTYWCRKTPKSSNTTQPTTNLVPIPFPLPQPLRTATDDRASLRLHVSEDITVEVDDNFSADTLCRLLAVLDQRP